MTTGPLATQLIALAVLLAVLVLLLMLTLVLLVRVRLGLAPLPAWHLPRLRLGRWGLWVLGIEGVLLVLTVVGIELWPVLRGPQPSAWPEVVVSHTPEAVARGRYLVQNVAHCTVCHSPRDDSRYSSPVNESQLGAGGVIPKEADYFPETMYPPNLTPTHLGAWTDAEIVRAITQGISRDGRALHPLMPYPQFGRLQPADVGAIVAYLRTLPPQPDPRPNRALSWAERHTAATAPRTLPMRINAAEPVSRGRYLVTIAACALCHTPTSPEGVPDARRAFAGGNALTTANGTIVRSANLTPDRETGIGYWTTETFLNRFAGFRDRSTLTTPTRGAYNTVMPWHHFAQMSEADLRDIHAYLRSLPAVRHEFERVVGVAEGH